MAREYWGNSCIILTRVSTNKQDYQAQIDDLTIWAKKLGYTNIYEISTKESGFRTFDLKDGFKKVIDYIENNNEYRTILITELSRLSRRRIILEQIKEYLTKNKIQLLVKDISFSLFDDNYMVNFTTDITFSLFASIAENEMRTKKLRFKRELASLHLKGVSITGKVLFGYERKYDNEIGKNIFVINEREAEEIKIIYDWYLNGINGDTTKSSMKYITLECIARGFSKYLHSKRNVTKCLAERAYVGFKKTNNIRKNPEYWDYGERDKAKYIKCSSEISYKPIIDENLFNAVQEKKKKQNILSDKSSKHVTLLSKLIICPSCGLYLCADYRIKNGYVANSYRCTRRNTVNNCISKKIYSMALLDSAIWSFIKHDISDLINKIREYYRGINIDDIYNEIDNLKNRINTLEHDKEVESLIFKTTCKTNKEERTERFISKILAIDKDISKLNLEIEERVKQVDSINNNRKINYKEEIEHQINEIENSKELLRKYIHLFVKKINILYSDLYYTVLKVTIIENVGERFDFNKEEFVDDKLSVDYFLVIDKRDNHRIKLRSIYNNECRFVNDHFELNKCDITLNNIFESICGITLEKAYSKIDKNTLKIIQKHTLAFDITEINYERLNIY